MTEVKDILEVKNILTEKYHAMYTAMIAKDIAKLEQLLCDSFVLVHMTGMRQNKQQFLNSLSNGTLNYFSEELHETSAHVSGDKATLVGKSYVSATVFGGGKHTWRLQLNMQFTCSNGDWKIIEAVASTW